MKIKIQVDAEEFLNSLKDDILASQSYVFIQAMSVEGDSAGKMLSRLLLSASASDKRILIDSFTKFKLSDKFLYFPKNLFDPELRKEVKETRKMVRHLGNSGVKVKFVNPYFGPFLMRFVARNHKKMVVIDDKIAYIGGINFSEHNFSWHDLMLRIEDTDIAEFLKKDFLATWSGFNQNNSRSFGEVKFHLLDGYSNETAFQPILDLIRGAKKSIWILSPYLTFPFFKELREVRHRGVDVTLITPQENNKRLFKKYILWESVRSGIDLKLYKNGMSHLKAILIDDEYLVVGSANFDYLSYTSQQEIVVVITKDEVISTFKERVIEEDLKKSRNFEGQINRFKGNFVDLGIKSLGRIATFLSRL